MNWYLLYCLSSRNLFDLDSIVIGREIMTTIKRLYETNQLKNGTINCKVDPAKLKNDELSNTLINLTIEKYNVLISSDGFEIGGYFLSGNTIEIVLRISNLFSDQLFEKMYIRLLNVIRHEVQHFVDFIRHNSVYKVQKVNFMNIVEKIREVSYFILSDLELVPYIRGMMLMAKRQRIPFKDVAKETIDRNFYGSVEYKNRLQNMSIFKDIKQIEDETLNKIMEKASEIFLNLREKNDRNI